MQLRDESSFVPDPATQAQIENDDDIWFGEDRLEVTVQVAASNAYYFLRRNVLPHQQLIEQQAEGHLLLRCLVNHPNQLLPIIRYWIPHVRILEPVWLQRLTARRAHRLLAVNNRTTDMTEMEKPLDDDYDGDNSINFEQVNQEQAEYLEAELSKQRS